MFHQEIEDAFMRLTACASRDCTNVLRTPPVTVKRKLGTNECKGPGDATLSSPCDRNEIKKQSGMKLDRVHFRMPSV